MSFDVDVLGAESYAREAADRLSPELHDARRAVVLTGGKTAAGVYEVLGRGGGKWPEIDVFFSDERCVPPNHDASNYGMTKRLLLDHAPGPRVHRMRGEDEPEQAARLYEQEIAPAMDAGIEFVLLGLGADAHVAALFPGSPALEETSRLCVPVDRPFGVKGLTLTPSALLNGDKILILASGQSKADAVRRVVNGEEPPQDCPARLLSGHPDVTFVLDTSAASLL